MKAIRHLSVNFLRGKTTYIVLFLMSFLIISCAKSPQSLEIKPASEETIGVLDKYLQVVDGLYTIFRIPEKTESGGFWYSIDVNLKNIGVAPNRFDNTNDLRLTIIDSNGVPFSGIGEFKLAMAESTEKFEKLLTTPDSLETIKFLCFAEKGSLLQKKGLPEPEQISGFEITSHANINYLGDLIKRYWKSSKDGNIYYFSDSGWYRNVIDCKNSQYTFKSNVLEFNGESLTIDSVSSSQIVFNDGDIKFVLAKHTDFIYGDWFFSMDGQNISMTFNKNGFASIKINYNNPITDSFIFIDNNTIKSGDGLLRFRILENKNKVELTFDNGLKPILVRKNCNSREINSSIETILSSNN